MAAPTGNVEPAAVDQDDAGDLPSTLSLLGFFLRSPRRRPAVAAGALVTGALITAAVAVLFPRTYVVEARILVQRHVMIPLFSNPHRPNPWEPEASPTRAAGETVLKRDNLLGIMSEAHLDERWSAERTPLGKLLDGVSFAQPPATGDRSRMILGTLEKRLVVQTDDNTVKITASWHQPETAYQIASAAVKGFLKDKSAQEAGAIAESVSLVEQEVARQREVLATSLASMQRLNQPTMLGGGESRGAGGRGLAAGGPPSSSEISGVLAEKRRAIQILEDARAHRLVELRVQLEDMRATLTPAHPSVLAMEEKIRIASSPTPELAALKQAEAEILTQIKGAAPASGSLPVAGGDGATAHVVLQRGEDPELSTARAKLSTAVQRYEELTDRLDSARLELLSEQAAFKYRYMVMVPPELPKQAAKPNLFLVVAVGALASVVLAFLAAALRDLLTGRFIEAWQVERKLPIPLLAEVDDP